ncbi:GDSL-type esterase/lipase family protein [Niveispirillum sp. KHB5.9]|uniref:GDSL-type esterase/lipase family protein n=1 Tax=Niveispirillum sp. KHB5.9 TaxID=3400269 RepID=UPI003A86555C
MHPTRRHLLGLLPAATLLSALPVGAAEPFQASDWIKRSRYEAANTTDKALPADRRRVVFIGDSITENWARDEYDGGFFPANGFIGRGISGQTTSQMLLRFVPDVLELQPRAVHILAGTNDVAENAGTYDAKLTQDNLAAMVALARAAGMKVFMGSVPPARDIYWRKSVGDPTERILALNEWIAGFCRRDGHTYIDYWPVLADVDKGLKAALGKDAVHPNRDGYLAMGPVALKALGKV